MADLVKFVDSIAASPTVRLDLNGEATNGWYCRTFSAPAPRLRRSVSSNAMRDGINVGSSSYDARTLVLELECLKNDQDSAATELQKLARELDREGNFLMYQPDGATKPVFFKTFRSDLAQIDDVIAQKAMRRFTVELLAEPFALGLRETLGPFTVNNDPAAASNGLFFDATGVVGDVAAPCVLRNVSNVRGRGFLSVRQRGTDFPEPARQAEAMSLGTDTANPGGGPDADMSGTDTNNFVRTTFATTTTLVTRLSFTITGTAAAALGRYRIIVCLRRSDATSAIAARAVYAATANGKVALPLTTNRILVDLGTCEVPNFGQVGDLAGQVGDLSTMQLSLQAERTSGAGTLDWDFLFLMPADEATCCWDTGAADWSSRDLYLDGGTEQIYQVDPVVGDPMTAPLGNASAAGAFAGSVPRVVPNQTNRIFLAVSATGSSGVHEKTIADVWEIHYWPRYLYVRPSTS